MRAFRKWFRLSFYEFLSSAIAIIGFAYVVIGLKANEKATLTSNYLQMFSWEFDVDKTFIDHPEIRCYFYGGCPITASDTSYERVLSVTLLMLDNFDAILSNQDYFNYDMTAKTNWINWVKDCFNTSPILCSTFAAHTDWYKPTLKDAFDNRKSRKPGK